MKRGGAWALLIGSIFAIETILYAINSGGGFWTWHTWRIVQPELEGIAWAGVIAGYIFARPLQWQPVQTAFSTAGLLSFSIYILHWPMVVIFWDVYRQYSPNLVSTMLGILLVTGFILLPPIVVLSALSYRCIEKPFLDMRKRYLPGASSEIQTMARTFAKD
jgi:peptidoglycan/LPS O-acetylase OafA/YrhL